MLKNAVDKLNWELVYAGDMIRAQAEGFPVHTWRVVNSRLGCDPGFDETITVRMIDFDEFRFFKLRRWFRRFFHMKDYIVWEIRIPPSSSFNKLS